MEDGGILEYFRYCHPEINMKKIIKLFDPCIGKEEEIVLKKVLYSGNWASGSGVGQVSKFEKAFQKYIGSKDAISVNSGTAALHLALSLLNIKEKEVILPSLSFVSTAQAVLYNGGIPVFADVNEKTLCLDPNDVKKKINEKTKVILPVHFAGMPAPLKEIQDIATTNHAIVVEDAAHACGSKYEGKKIGSHSPLVCFSFHPVKNLAMPTGGLIAINDKNIKNKRKKLESKRWCGISNRHEFNYDVSEIGWNFYMNEFAAAIGLSQLKKLDKLNERRKTIAKRYHKEIELEFKMVFDKNCVYHFYWIRVNNRKKFMKEMAKKGIGTGIHYKPIHKMTLFRDSSPLKNTEKLMSQIVSIPTHPNLTDVDIDKIIKNVNILS